MCYNENKNTKKDSPKKIYVKNCAMSHNSGLAGAPKRKDKVNPLIIHIDFLRIIQKIRPKETATLISPRNMAIPSNRLKAAPVFLTSRRLNNP